MNELALKVAIFSRKLFELMYVRYLTSRLSCRMLVVEVVEHNPLTIASVYLSLIPYNSVQSGGRRKSETQFEREKSFKRSCASWPEKVTPHRK